MKYKQTFTVIADEDTIRSLHMFFAFLHYNGGHSGTFGIHFDGDGHQRCQVDPPPPEWMADHVHMLSGWSDGAEIADAEFGYYTKKLPTWPEKCVEQHGDELKLIEYKSWQDHADRKGTVIDSENLKEKHEKFKKFMSRMSQNSSQDNTQPNS